MRVFLVTLIVYIMAVIDTSLVDVIRIGDVTPDLLALLAIVWLLIASGPRAFLVAGAIALVGDLIAPGRLGLGFGWMLLVGYGVTRLRARFPNATTGRGFILYELAWQVPCVWAAETVWATAVGLTSRLLGDVSLPWSILLGRAAGVGLYTAAVALPVFMLLGWTGQPYLARQRRLAEF